jgi:hypothetical protein
MIIYIYIYESQSFVHICAGYSCWKLMSPLCGTTCVLRPWWHFGILMREIWGKSSTIQAHQRARGGKRVRRLPAKSGFEFVWRCSVWSGCLRASTQGHQTQRSCPRIKSPGPSDRRSLLCCSWIWHDFGLIWPFWELEAPWPQRVDSMLNQAIDCYLPSWTTRYISVLPSTGRIRVPYEYHMSTMSLEMIWDVWMSWVLSSLSSSQLFVGVLPAPRHGWPQVRSLSLEPESI